jgi:hypothetical protein
MADATDLRALARKRAALITTARATADRAFNHLPVAQSHSIGNATVRPLRQPDDSTVAVLSDDAATDAIHDSRASRTVASPIGCDNATPGNPVPKAVEREGKERRVHQGASKRPPAWAEPTDPPLPGSSCSCCGLGQWWCERDTPKGWRCRACHPPDHLAPDAVTEARR